MKKIISILTFFVHAYIGFAQCPDGSVGLDANSSDWLNINYGETYCLAEGVEYTGNIQINGGTLISNGNLNVGQLYVNSGSFVLNGPFSYNQFGFNGGTLINNSDLVINSYFQIKYGAVLINNKKLTINGTLPINGGKLKNYGDLEVSSELINNGTVENEGNIFVKGKVSLNSNSSFVNKGNIYIEDKLVINSAATLETNGVVIIEGVITNNGGSIVNNGTLSTSTSYDENPREDASESILVEGFYKELAENGLIDSKGRIPCIIEFNEPSLWVKEKNGIVNNFDYDAQFDVFIDRLKTFVERKGLDSDDIIVANKITKISNKLVIKVPREMFNVLSAFPHVKDVTIDIILESYVNVNKAHINADLAQTSYNKGEGIKVGIIDSGIDYNHPAFVGALGGTSWDATTNSIKYNEDGCKVCGGYDFGNNDNNPMDFQSHGTHVAGIIAGNGGGVTGVAPEAMLYALKVNPDYDSNGIPATGGSLSNIFLAFEWALDPKKDGRDPGFDDDRLDVINLSMGANDTDFLPINYTDEMDVVIEAGIIVCIATGNSGNFFDIGVPATHSDVISVGNSDKNTSIADSSSRGPGYVDATDKFDYIMKPDVVAPGTKITSSILNGLNGSKTGTSMATPMVAGATALIKKAHSTWTNKDIKSVLMTTATILNNENIMSQGSGLINVTKAIETNFIFHRIDSDNKIMGIGPVLNFNSITLQDENEWESVEMLIRVQNLEATDQELTIPMQSNFPAGMKLIVNAIDLSTTGHTFTIAANGTADLTFILQATKDQLVPPQLGLYGGYIDFNISGVKQAHIPWNVTSQNKPFVIEFVDALPGASVSGTNLVFVNEANPAGIRPKMNWITSTTANVFIDAGTYDVVAYVANNSQLVIDVEEGLVFDYSDLNKTLTIEEGHFLDVDFNDKDGNVIENAQMIFTMYNGNFPLVNTIFSISKNIGNVSIGKRDLYINDTKYQYAISYFSPLVNGDSYYMYDMSFITAGLSADEYVNTQSDYSTQKIQFNYIKDHGVTDVKLGIYAAKALIFDENHLYIDQGFQFDLPTELNVYYKANVAKPVNDVTGNMSSKFALYSPTEGVVLSSAYFMPDEEKFSFSQYPWIPNPTQDGGGETILGETFGFPSVNYIPSTNLYTFTYNGMNSEIRSWDNTRSSYKSSVPALNYVFEDFSTTKPKFTINGLNGSGYKFVIEGENTNFSENSTDLTGNFKMTINYASVTDNCPPEILDYKVINEGVVGHQITSSDSYVSFRIIDEINAMSTEIPSLQQAISVSSCQFFMKKAGEADWSESTIESTETDFVKDCKVNFNDITENGYYDIRILLSDAAGNITDWTLLNAFNIDLPAVAVAIIPATGVEYYTIQEAIDAAAGKSVEIYPGHYYENLTVSSDVINSSIIISGVYNDPTAVVISPKDESLPVFTIEPNDINGIPGIQDEEMFMCDIDYVTLIGSATLNSTSYPQNGGAITTKNIRILHLDNVSFTNFKATDGGAVYLENSQIQLNQNVLFESNYAENNGGAMYFKNCGRLLVSGEFKNNIAKNNGGAIFEEGTILGGCHPYLSSHIYSGVCEGNQALGNGGALYLANNDGVQIMGLKCINNFASVNGGAIFAQNTDMLIEKDFSSELGYKSFGPYVGNEAIRGAAIYSEGSNLYLEAGFYKNSGETTIEFNGLAGNDFFVDQSEFNNNINSVATVYEILSSSSLSKIMNCSFIENYAPNAGDIINTIEINGGQDVHIFNTILDNDYTYVNNELLTTSASYIKVEYCYISGGQSKLTTIGPNSISNIIDGNFIHQAVELSDYGIVRYYPASQLLAAGGSIYEGEYIDAESVSVNCASRRMGYKSPFPYDANPDIGAYEIDESTGELKMASYQEDLLEDENVTPLQENVEVQVSVLPILVKDVLTITVSNIDVHESYIGSIINMVNMQVVEPFSVKAQTEVNMSNVSSGVYLVRIENTKGLVKTIRVIKE
jgi:serine protease AprX